MIAAVALIFADLPGIMYSQHRETSEHHPANKGLVIQLCIFSLLMVQLPALVIIVC